MANLDFHFTAATGEVFVVNTITDGNDSVKRIEQHTPDVAVFGINDEAMTLGISKKPEDDVKNIMFQVTYNGKQDGVQYSIYWTLHPDDIEILHTTLGVLLKQIDSQLANGHVIDINRNILRGGN